MRDANSTVDSRLKGFAEADATILEGRHSGTVSVVIPAYNQSQFLGEAIRSVITQDYPDTEIIVVDDGSTDETPLVAAQFGERVRYIRQRNGGLSAARNTGIRAARGEYIALLDADDFWQPGFLPEVVRHLDNNHRLGAVHTGQKFVDRQGKPLYQYGVETVPDHRLYDRLLDGEFFGADSVLVRRECFDRVGLFDEELRGSEDWDMWLRVSREFRFAGIPKPLLNYRMHGDNMSADPSYMLRYQLRVVEKHFGKPEGPAASWPIDRQRSYATVYRYAALGYYQRGDAQQGNHFLRLALEANPRLAQSLSLFYELGCADQPLGRRGDLVHLNFEQNASKLLSGLGSIFSQPDISSRLQSQRSTAFAHACLALGLLAYGSDHWPSVRTYLFRALCLDPLLLMNRHMVLTLSRTLLGQRLLQALKSAASSVAQMNREKI